MATLPAASILPLIPLLLQLLCASPSLSFSHNHSSPIGFSARLINPNSPRSPFYNPNLAHSDRLKAFVKTTIARQRYLQSKTIKPNDEINPPLKVHDYAHVISFSIGTPPVETYAVADTASSLTWLQCLPCKRCYDQTPPLYDPGKSSSVQYMSCNDTLCTGPRLSCLESFCHYVEVQEAGFSGGDLIRETLGVRSNEDPSGKKDLQDIIIGCGHDNANGDYGNSFPGVFGLNRDTLSVVTQLQYGGFSYCLIPRDNLDAENSIHFKLNGMVTRSATPIIDGDPDNTDAKGDYYVTVDGISVEGHRLRWMEPERYVIDSSSPYSSLNANALQILTDAFSQIAKVDDPLRQFDTCFRPPGGAFPIGPTLTFHFAGGVNLDIGAPNLWVDHGDGIYCLAILLTPSDLNILGNYQLQNVNMEYDLQNKLISFQNMDCAQTG